MTLNSVFPSPRHVLALFLPTFRSLFKWDRWDSLSLTILSKTAPAQPQHFLHSSLFDVSIALITLPDLFIWVSPASPPIICALMTTEIYARSSLLYPLSLDCALTQRRSFMTVCWIKEYIHRGNNSENCVIILKMGKYINTYSYCGVHSGCGRVVNSLRAAEWERSGWESRLHHFLVVWTFTCALNLISSPMN